MAEAFAEVERRSVPKVPTLRGKVVATLFFEESTRTRLSFETAAKRLSADVLSLAVASSSVKKGECAARHGRDGRGDGHRRPHHPPLLGRARRTRWRAGSSGPASINAGDGWHEHPTQALLDCFTVRQVLAERKGAAPDELGIDCFEGLRVLIVGDVRHSRVARSEVLAYTALGAHVTLAAPGSLLPPSLEGWPVDGGRRPRRGARPTPTSSRCSACRPSGGAGPSCPACASTPPAGGSPARRVERLGRRRHRHAPRARWCAGSRSPPTWPTCRARS